MNEAEFIERYMILLLGASEKPLPSDLHLQKEIFLLSNFKETIAESFNFQKHYFGPYSQVLDEALKNPAYFSDAFDFSNKKILLTDIGKKEFLSMIKKFSKEIDFQVILSSLRLLRNLYDKLTRDELLLLIYITYPEYTEFSQVSDRLLKNEFTRNKLLESIFSKGLITEERYKELKNGKQKINS
jgi:uncharacterized protein YwgA